MAKTFYLPVNGESVKPKKWYVPVDGESTKVVKAYCSDDGLSKQFYSSGWIDHWESVSTLPYGFYNGSACVFQDKIHILGGQGNTKKHYSWDGTTWTEESELPYNCTDTGIAVYKDRIHILGTTSDGYGGYACHYAWDGTSWTQLTNIPIYFYGKNRVTVYNNKIYMVSSGFGSYDQFRYIYTWDDSSWVRLLDLGTGAMFHQTTVVEDKLQILTSNGDHHSRKSYDGQSLVSETAEPFDGFYMAALEYDKALHMLGHDRNHYMWTSADGWKQLNNMPYDFNNCPAVEYRGRIHILGAYLNNAPSTNHYAFGA